MTSLGVPEYREVTESATLQVLEKNLENRRRHGLPG